MDLGLDGRRAAVAAASSGLGLGAARALAAAGARVALCGRDGDRVRDAAEAVGGTAIVADVGTAEGAEDFVHAARGALGGIDVLVVNGGGPPPATATQGDTAGYRAALESNCAAPIAMCQAAVGEMRERGWGRIVAITSAAVRQPNALLAYSNTARAGLTGYLKTLAREIAGDGVTVNSLQPGLHDTGRLRALYGDDLSGAADSVPAGVVGDADEFGAFVAFLCSERAGFVTGTAIPVDGGAYAALL